MWHSGPLKNFFFVTEAVPLVAYVSLNPSQKDLRTVTDCNASSLTSTAAGVESGRQSGVRPLVQWWGAVRSGCRCGESWGCQRWRTEEQGALLVLLEHLRSQASMTGGQEVQEGRVTVLMNSVWGQRALVGAQTLANHPALHPRVKAVLKKHLQAADNQQKKGHINFKWKILFFYPFRQVFLIIQAYLLFECCSSHIWENLYSNRAGWRRVLNNDRQTVV